MNKTSYETTIQKTLMTARLFDGFWDRWVAHGLIASEIAEIKNSLITVEDWEYNLQEMALRHAVIAQIHEVEGNLVKAENELRIAGLYYNLIHWIYPERTREKIDWYENVLKVTEKADSLSSVSCQKEMITIDGVSCVGRIRTPLNPKGVIVIINPIDSTKEELYSYEKQFINEGYITVSFDGPGQGETYTINGLTASNKRWGQFVDAVIEFSSNYFPNLLIYLFGTSSGAAWAIYGSTKSEVRRVASVSPPVSSGEMPIYFGERLQFIVESEEHNIIPELSLTDDFSGIHLFHGNQDVMVQDDDMYSFYEKLPFPKQLTEYPNEGHCCNFALDDVRKKAMTWFCIGGKDNE